MNKVNIGGPIALAVVGAILWLAVGKTVVFGALSLGMVGLILFFAAFVWLALGLLMSSQKRRTTETSVTHDSTGRAHVDEREVESTGM